MRCAITQLFPSSVHRLCSWHLEINAGNYEPNGEFKIAFSKLMYNFYAEEEFEEQRKQLVQGFKLETSEYANNFYGGKTSWAETFLRGHFFGGMRSTLWCESMISYMKHFPHGKHLMCNFASQTGTGIQNIRHTELQDDFSTKHIDPLIPAPHLLSPYYQQVAAIYTRAIYKLVANEISGHTAYSISGSDHTREYRIFRLSKFRFGETCHQVRYSNLDNKYWCGCMLFETEGIPCHRIFVVMKHLSILHIPASPVER